MGQVTLAALAAFYVAEKRATGRFTDGTAANTGYTLAGFVAHVGGDRAAAEVTAGDVAGWVAVGRWAPSTTRMRLSQMNSWWGWLIDRGHATSNPVRPVARPRAPLPIPRGLAPGRVAATLGEACPDRRARMMVLLMVQEGLRCCEVARLEVGDVDARDQVVMVRGKGRRQRVLPLSDESAAAIRAYRRARPRVVGDYAAVPAVAGG